MAVVEFEEALRIAQGEAARVAVRGSETVGLLEAAGRVLAVEVRADRDQPGFDRATRDGFCLRAADAGGALKIVGELRAGGVWAEEVAAGTAVRIMTGAAVPRGADAVVMVEHTAVDGEVLRVEAGRRLVAGENVVGRGREAQEGDALLGVGWEIGAAEIAVAAGCGYAEVRVFERASVAIVSTGDELVEVTETPGEVAIRNSNSYAIAAMVRAAGGEARRLGIARDLRGEIAARVEEARGADLMVLSGGVSMGEYDLVEEVLEAAGAEFLFTGVKMQPGKPVVFGKLPARGEGGRECYFFGLPGNPISAQVTFHCFAEPFLRALGGAGWVGPQWALATLGEGVEAKAGLTRLLPGRRDGVGVKVVGWQGSGDLAANARANCYVELLPEREYAAGEIVRVLLR